MRSLFLSVMLVLFFIGGASAAQFGTPVATAEGFGDVSVGVGYSHLSADWDVENSSAFKQTKTDMAQYFAQAGLGFAKEWEGYMRVGLSILEADYAFNIGGTDIGADGFENGPVPFVSMGVNGKLIDGDEVDLGFFVQGSYFDTFEDEGPPEAGISLQSNPPGSAGFATKVTAIFDKMWLLDIGLMAETVFEGVHVYGGPVLYFGQTDAFASASGLAQTGTMATTTPAGLIVASTSADLDEEGFLGLNFGARWLFDSGVRLDVEFEKRSNVNVGFMLRYDY